MTSPRLGRPPKVNGVDPDTRERLLEAAVEAFLDFGFENVTLEQVAERAGVTSGAIYNHFNGKSALLIQGARWALAKVPPRTYRNRQELAGEVDQFFLPSNASRLRQLLVGLHIAAARHPDLAKMLADWRQEQLKNGEGALPGMTPAKLKVYALLSLGLCHLDSMADLEAPTDEMSEGIRRAFSALFEGSYAQTSNAGR